MYDNSSKCRDTHTLGKTKLNTQNNLRAIYLLVILNYVTVITNCSKESFSFSRYLTMFLNSPLKYANYQIMIFLLGSTINSYVD